MFIIDSIVPIFSFSINAQPGWTREYFFFKDGGETADGTKIYIPHTLEIFKGPDKELKVDLYKPGLPNLN